jgi:hypothetical protein
MDSRNPTQNGRPVAEQLQEAARQGVEQSYALSKQVLDAWTTSTEAALKASFDLQNAAIEAGQAIIGPAGSPNQALYRQWTDTVRLAQQATLDALDATRRLTKYFAPAIEK